MFTCIYLDTFWANEFVFLSQMPEFPTAHYNKYLLSITDTHDNVYKTQYIYFRPYGYILVKTDKPIYKPSQTGKYNVNKCQ